MRRRLVSAFVGLAVGVLAVAWAGMLLSDATGSVVPGLLLALVALAGAGTVGVVVADRVSRPFRDLTVAAAHIRDGQFDAAVPYDGMPEAEQLGRSLRGAAARLDELVGREQAVAVAASHELRTPITALRLSLEDLTLWKQTPPEVVAEISRSITELDRLSDAVTELLDRQDRARDRTPVDVALLASDAVARWSTQTTDVEIALDAPRPAPVQAPASAVVQVLDAMLAHAATRSSGGVSIDVVRVGETVRIRVCHEDPRALPTGVIHGTTPAGGTDGDPGLAEAGAVAESMGGRLGVEDSPGTCLVLLVPSAGPPDPA